MPQAYSGELSLSYDHSKASEKSVWFLFVQVTCQNDLFERRMALSSHQPKITKILVDFIVTTLSMLVINDVLLLSDSKTQ